MPILDPLASFRLDGRVALVTGANTGIGLAIATRLLADGFALGYATVDEASKGPLDELQGEIVWVTGDLSDAAVPERLVAETVAKFGRIDVLVNNAGRDPGVRLAEMTMDDVRGTFEVNFFAAVAGTLAVLPAMVDRGSGIVVNVSSDGGRLPSPGPGVYPASKAALSAFTESVSFRVRSRGVAMHILYPAWMPTAMGREALGRGLRAPPRLTRRTEAEVAGLLLDKMGGRALDISASPLIDAAAVLRAVAPKTYHYFRRTW